MSQSYIKLCLVSMNDDGKATMYFKGATNGSFLNPNGGHRVFGVRPVLDGPTAEEIVRTAFSAKFVHEPSVHANAYEGLLCDIDRVFQDALISARTAPIDVKEPTDSLSLNYIVSSDIIENKIKVGSWRGNLRSLRLRYVTDFGNELRFLIFETKLGEHKIVEKRFHQHFKGDKIPTTRENYPKDMMDRAVLYLTSKCDRVAYSPIIDEQLHGRRVRTSTAHVTRMMQRQKDKMDVAAGLMRSLFPDVDPLKVLKDGEPQTTCGVGCRPHTIAIKTNDLHDGLDRYISGIGVRNKGAMFKLFDYNANLRFDTPRSKTEFVKAVLHQGLSLLGKVPKTVRNTFVIACKDAFDPKKHATTST